MSLLLFPMVRRDRVAECDIASTAGRDRRTAGKHDRFHSNGTLRQSWPAFVLSSRVSLDFLIGTICKTDPPSCASNACSCVCGMVCWPEAVTCWNSDRSKSLAPPGLWWRTYIDPARDESDSILLGDALERSYLSILSGSI